MTKVKFVIFEGECVAIFPDELYNEQLYGNTLLSCYSHIGQHSCCSPDIGRPATHKEYQELKKELESIGYNLVN